MANWHKKTHTFMLHGALFAYYLCIITLMLIINYLLAIATFIVIYLAERLVLFWIKKKPMWPLISYDLLVDAISYTAAFLVLIGILHLVFKKVDTLGLIWFDIALYLVIKFIRPHHIFFKLKNKENIEFEKGHVISILFFTIMMVECFAFNYKAYSGNKDVTSYQNFVCDDISSDGTIESNKITLTNKQCIYIETHDKGYDSIYLSFDNSDMNLYVNIFEMRDDSPVYQFKEYALIDPKYDAYGYISLKDMGGVKSLKIEFDIDDSRYLNNSSKPIVVVTKICFDEYFPLIVNPIRLAGLFLLVLLVANFKKVIISSELKDDLSPYQKLEKVILLGGTLFFVIFIIQALANSSAYFIKYDELYLGGTSSNNIYYQQFAAYLKGQLHLDVDVDPRLATLTNPYDPSKRAGMTVLWDHAFYNGKYYSYYGHAPIYLVMFPIYLVSGYVPSNLFILQFGVLFSIYAFLLVGIQVIKLFVKKCSTTFLVLTLIAMVFGSLLFTNNTYEYGGMVYRIPYAYANGFLFLTIYLFIKGYNASNWRFIYFIFTGLSLVFIVLSRPLEIIYLFLFVPIIIKMIKESNVEKKQIIIDYVPAISVVFIGAIFVCIMNYVRFESIFEFGEHYQLTVTDCRNNSLDIDGILPTIYHFFIKKPKYNEENKLLLYRSEIEKMDIHPYITSSVGLLFVPITLFIFLIPFVLQKEDSLSFKIFIITSPLLVFFVAFINYCFAGVCPRYLNDFAPWAALTGGIVALKALEKDNGKHPVVPSLICVTLIISVLISFQYHFIEFDGLKIGDFYGLLSIVKSITNQYNI